MTARDEIKKRLDKVCTPLSDDGLRTVAYLAERVALLQRQHGPLVLAENIHHIASLLVMSAFDEVG